MTNRLIELRDLSEGDRRQLYDWRLNPEVDRWLNGAAPADMAAHDRWFDTFLADPDLKGWIILKAGAPVGFLSLKGLTGQHRRAEWAWYIGDADARGQGVGRAAQALGLDRAFDQLGLHKVWSEVPAGNDAAMKAQTSAGFRREGYMRSHAIKKGEPHDVVLLAILADEWRAKRAAVRRDLAGSQLIAA